MIEIFKSLFYIFVDQNIILSPLLLHHIVMIFDKEHGFQLHFRETSFLFLFFSTKNI